MSDQTLLARQEGLLPSPEGAATFTALRHLREKGLVDPGEKGVPFNTGNAMKYPYTPTPRHLRKEAVDFAAMAAGA